MKASRLITVVAAAAAVAMAGSLPVSAAAAPRVPPQQATKQPTAKPSKNTVYAPVVNRKLAHGKKVTRDGARLAAYGAGSWVTGNCNGNSLLQLGTWDATAMLNSTYAGGDTLYFKFHLYDRAKGTFVVSTDWTSGDWVRQAPSLTWIPNFGVPFNIVRNRWYAVYLETWSYKAGGVIDRGYVPMQRVGADLSQTDGTWYCKAL